MSDSMKKTKPVLKYFKPARDIADYPPALHLNQGIWLSKMRDGEHSGRLLMKADA